MNGAHFHFYYQQNNHKSIEAKDILKQLATEEFGLSLDFCPDRNGHEEPHNEVCWLSGPEGKSQLPMSAPISMLRYNELFYCLFVATKPPFKICLPFHYVHRY